VYIYSDIQLIELIKLYTYEFLNYIRLNTNDIQVKNKIIDFAKTQTEMYKKQYIIFENNHDNDFNIIMNRIFAVLSRLVIYPWVMPIVTFIGMFLSFIFNSNKGLILSSLIPYGLWVGMNRNNDNQFLQHKQSFKKL